MPFLGCQIAILRHQLVDALGHLRPGHQHIPTLGLSKPYSFAIVIFVRKEVVRERGVSAAGAIQVFQENGLFFCHMRLLPVLVDAHFPVLIGNPSAERVGNIVLGDEMPYLRQLPHVCLKAAPGKIQFLQPLQKLCRTVESESEKVMILLPCLIKSTVFSQDRFTLLRICERRRNTQRHIRVTAALVLIHDGENTGFPRFFAEIMREI